MGGSGNFFSGLGHGMMGILGLGSLWNPLEPYQKELSEANNKLKATVTQGTLAVMQGEQAEIEQLWALFEEYMKYDDFQTKYTQDLSTFATNENRDAIIILVIIILVIILYLLIAPK